MSAGLPNITGVIGADYSTSADKAFVNLNCCSGCFSPSFINTGSKKTFANGSHSDKNTTNGFYLDASKSYREWDNTSTLSSYTTTIYGSSSTVTPLSRTCKFIIKY